MRTPRLLLFAVLAFASLVAWQVARGCAAQPAHDVRDGETEPRPQAHAENAVGAKLIFVAPQEFVMGTPGAAARSDEQPRRVNITTGYWLSATEVTQEQWRTLMLTRPWRGQPGTIEGRDVAATHVSWEDATHFCRKLTERERRAGRLPSGYVYCLPTEAEWELACRAGSRAAYCFGDAVSMLSSYAICLDARTGEHADFVRQRRPNVWCMYDMHGNVWEWCADAAGDSGSMLADGNLVTRTLGGIDDPLGRAGPLRICRGGAFCFSARYLRSANRFACDPAEASFCIGFRLALAVRADRR